MDFKESILNLSNRIPNIVANVKTEEATKTGLIMPFIQILGYNVFDPTEVCPECIADVGTKKGEKVDYAIMKDGEPIILVECKAADVDLSTVHKSQLYRYFTVMPAKIGILTNGVNYQFYSDFEDTNKLDSKPFLEIDMQSPTEPQIEALKQFRKDVFNVEKILPSAKDMKYIKAIKQIFSSEIESPSEDFVRYVAGKVYDGRITKHVLDDFTGITKRAFNQLISEMINNRLQSAMSPSEDIGSSVEGTEESTPVIVTTEVEIEGYNIIRAIVSEIIDPERVFMRDVKTYCGILVDDNNRKPICRMYFNGKKKSIGVFVDGEQNIHHIEKTVEIYKYASELREAAKQYNN